jgi:hypothetical protein
MSAEYDMLEYDSYRADPPPRPPAELFDTSEYAPLFAGVPIAAPADSGKRPTPRREQTAWCCAQCGGDGPFLTTRAGAAVCYTCAKQASKRRP